MGVFDDIGGSAKRAPRELLRLGLPEWHEVQNKATGGASGWAVSLAVASQLPGRLDGPADAYRHLLIAAELTRLYGAGYAYLLLQGHELDQSLFSDGPMDEYNNSIGQQIGQYVRSQNGTTADVIKFANTTMLNSFPGGSSANVSWVPGSETGWQVKGANTTQLPNGVIVQPVAVAEKNPGKWLSGNPVDNKTKKLLPTNSVNWPTPGWKQKFDYTGAQKAPEYLQWKVPINPLPVYSQETDLEEASGSGSKTRPAVNPVDPLDPDTRKRDRGDQRGLNPAVPADSDGFTPGRGDLFKSSSGGLISPQNLNPDHSNLHDIVPNGQADRVASLAAANDFDLYQMAEEVFSSLTLDDWAIIPDDNDPFDNRDPFRDGVKWVPGLGPPPATP